jgi:hypothetical protein
MFSLLFDFWHSENCYKFILGKQKRKNISKIIALNHLSCKVHFWGKIQNKKYLELVNKQKLQQKQLNNPPATLYQRHKAFSLSRARWYKGINMATEQGSRTPQRLQAADVGKYGGGGGGRVRKQGTCFTSRPFLVKLLNYCKENYNFIENIFFTLLGNSNIWLGVHDKGYSMRVLLRNFRTLLSRGGGGWLSVGS